MKKLIIGIILVLGQKSFCGTVTYNDPSHFQPYGQGSFSISTDTNRLFNGESTIKISKSSGQYAGLFFNSVDPISRISYYQYDEFGSSTPFYNYIFMYYTPNFSKWITWRDSGYGGTIGVEGGGDENYLPYGSLARSVGWHKIDAIVDDQYINFKIDDVAIGRATYTDPIFKVAFDISGGGGNVSYNIAQVTVQTVPEPSAVSLLSFGLGGLAMMRRRRS